MNINIILIPICAPVVFVCACVHIQDARVYRVMYSNSARARMLAMRRPANATCVCVCVPLVVKSINSSSYKFQLYKLAEAATVRTVCLV